jgi:hypothetical protein
MLTVKADDGPLPERGCSAVPSGAVPDLDDLRLERADDTEGEPGDDRRRRFPLPLAAGLAVAVVLTAVLGYVVFRRLSTPTRTPSPAIRGGGAAGARPDAPVPLPPLNSSDTFVRDLARGLSTHPGLAAWLAPSGLVRGFTTLVEKVAADEPVREGLGVLAPQGTFAVIERGGVFFADPAGHARYDAFADVVSSLDAAACARAYRVAEPLFEAGYRELGHPEGGFSPIMLRALATLADTPVPEGEVPLQRVQRVEVVYLYADPELEALAPPQKHLLRMGPSNARRVQAKLHEIQQALEAAVDTSAKP